MIKKLDILVLKAFIGPFIATFFLTLFVLILQFFWLWIDDFVGKGIDGMTIVRLIIYLSATLVPLALPLAVLLSSIMTFGNLGETFELVAIKSAGIGLLRFMRSLLVTTLLLAVLAFYFNNNVIPVANLKMKTLQYDLVNQKPAFDLKEGTFYNMIPGYSIKVAKKVNDSVLNDIIIFETSPNVQDNMISARRGVMRMSDDKRYLEFTLQDGWRYEEEGERTGVNSRFYRLGFKEYKKVLDLSALMRNFTSDSVYKDRAEMLTILQLNRSIDSVQKMLNQFHERHKAEMKAYLPFMQYMDSGWAKVRVPALKKDTPFIKTLPDSARVSVIDQSISFTSSLKSTLDGAATDYENRRKELRIHLMTWHEKFTMSIAVLVLFLIGAPLGSIVRKGGIGTPVVFAVIFFVVFFLLNNFGKKFVKEDVLQPIAGMWLATIVLLPIGFFLIYKALHDSQLFNKEFYYRFFRKLRKKKAAAKEPDELPTELEAEISGEDLTIKKDQPAEG
ncbi:LptF/LptG family permease [Paraflavitalea sp. CAU 1676]|uniref:LptF/LptG family permease n=1 Tax=Paraflavitalea sp. CAU 1676 TaxID=3032598 RepID=UPI0023DC889C|nr:LptF/LptG family permease [Paraflavitalea sp. CAU 1676]MDF2193025.1 LptF/LptG family permease [Paraflavitalea sp. CAU 1676]